MFIVFIRFLNILEIRGHYVPPFSRGGFAPWGAFGPRGWALPTMGPPAPMVTLTQYLNGRTDGRTNGNLPFLILDNMQFFYSSHNKLCFPYDLMILKQTIDIRTHFTSHRKCKHTDWVCVVFMKNYLHKVGLLKCDNHLIGLNYITLKLNK